MLRLKTDNEKSYLMLINPNDTLDFISSISTELNNILQENEEEVIGKVKITYGPSKKTSEQESEKYEGVKAFATLLKKSIASIGTNGYFSGSKDRWKYTLIDQENNKKYFKNFDNHIKINFRCKTAKERETLKTIVQILFTLYSRKLKCSICDLDYIEDVESIKDELYEFNLYIFARTVLKFEYDNNQEPLKDVDYIVGLQKETIIKEDIKEQPDNDEVIFENGF